MKTLILCSKHPLETHSVDLIIKQTHGTLCNFIEFSNNESLANYDQMILVYQHPLDSINRSFIQFCESNSLILEKSVLIVDLPLSYANALDPKLFADRINNLSNTLTLKCGYDVRAASIFINKLVINKLRWTMQKSWIRT